ncbi:hypothetical protein Sros_9219 [Streptosporangium roseum DSM 43021]|uniref:Uncharacterized protein n=1 Tax=Streptosporangium roseum (strain ATCC 12428 / DSM 43021 / JCM 3005 / KCTC 9067 / NCIMB 10171 / NRRL 2505 / NI 9100) TaxID=479432 RepID=D2BCL7_STRRD|nr:hypothetical protein Sros_9219 [Streptosporangium roseum DSM 43021]
MVGSGRCRVLTGSPEAGDARGRPVTRGVWESAGEEMRAVMTRLLSSAFFPLMEPIAANATQRMSVDR